MNDEMTPGQQAAAFHGIVINCAFPCGDRLQAGIQALDLYAAELEQAHQRIADLEADDDYLGGLINDLETQVAAAQREAAAMRLVVQAAEAIVAALRKNGWKPDNVWFIPETVPFAAAVDLYREGRK